MVPPINATKHPQGAMMLGVVASDGKSMPPYGSLLASRWEPMSIWTSSRL
ncbi:Hypothetical protein FKW44_010961 [Caligus rogercresseyi]|uniref:Uncharacterized protein n=1 Tax=Caligus rogercresseyi TaxID=217165 RepID=A0A7T8K9Y0_CALRO|nr:Hypothetical protein FKW44_010961 [Caligus rogercresseyi]